MYGKLVTIGEHKIWIWCTPSISQNELRERAEKKLNKYLRKEIDSLA